MNDQTPVEDPLPEELPDYIAYIQGAQLDYLDELRRWGFADDADIAPPDLEIDEAQWRHLREVYRTSQTVASAVRALLGSLSAPIRETLRDVEVAQRHYRTWVRECLDLINSVSGSSPIPTLQDPAGDYLVYRDALTAAATCHLLADFEHIGERAQRLVSHLVPRATNRTAEYLTRVSRCYLYDLRTELAVMARAAIEAEILMVATDKQVQARVGGRSPPGLAQRIEYCRSTGVFDTATYHAAIGLKDDGDDAVHTAAQQAPPVDDTIDRLVLVLDALCRRPSG